jgi:hypothetical protein
VVVLWAWATEGSLAPRRVTVESEDPRLAAPRKLEAV